MIVSADQKQASDWLEIIRSQVDSLQFGVVQIVVHDGRVVQVERTEKLRILQKPEATDRYQTSGALTK